jgi:hypothetical protein
MLSCPPKKREGSTLIKILASIVALNDPAVRKVLSDLEVDILEFGGSLYCA